MRSRSRPPTTICWRASTRTCRRALARRCAKKSRCSDRPACATSARRSRQIVDVIRTLEENGQIVIARGAQRRTAGLRRPAVAMGRVVKNARGQRRERIVVTPRTSSVPTAAADGETSDERSRSTVPSTPASSRPSRCSRRPKPCSRSTGAACAAKPASCSTAPRRTRKRCSHDAASARRDDRRAAQNARDADCRASARPTGHEEGIAAGLQRPSRDGRDARDDAQPGRHGARRAPQDDRKRREPETRQAGDGDRRAHPARADRRRSRASSSRRRQGRDRAARRTRSPSRVRVNPVDLERMRQHRDSIAGAGESKHLRVIEDQRVDPGGVVVETDGGTIDAKISTQIEKPSASCTWTTRRRRRADVESSLRRARKLTTTQTCGRADDSPLFGRALPRDVYAHRSGSPQR